MSRLQATARQSIIDITGEKPQYAITSTDIRTETGEKFLTYGFETYIDFGKNMRLKVYEFRDFSVRKEDCEALIEKLISEAVSITQLHFAVLKELGSI